MIKAKEMPSREELRKRYDYKDGELFFKEVHTNCVSIGDKVGTTRKVGYNITSINGVTFKNSRLIYQYHYGDLGMYDIIDHIDSDKGNDNIDNLQVTTTAGNNRKALNKRCDYSKYIWVNMKTYSVEIMNKYDLADKYNLHTGTLSRILNSKRTNHADWYLLSL